MLGMIYFDVIIYTFYQPKSNAMGKSIPLPRHMIYTLVSIIFHCQDFFFLHTVNAEQMMNQSL